MERLSNTIKLLFLLILILVPMELFSGQILEEAWKSFDNNDYKKAKEMFSLSGKENINDRVEANLMQLLLISQESGESDCLKYLKDVYPLLENPNPYLIALWSSKAIMRVPPRMDENLTDFLEELVENPKTDGTVKAWIYEVLEQRYDWHYKIAKSNKAGVKIGAIYDWQAVGAFENISASGFDKSFPPIDHPESDFIFKNREGAGVKWFNLVKPALGKWMNLAMNFIFSNSIIYTQSFCNSTVDQEVQLRVGTSGSIKIWVNDNLVISESEERNNGLDTYVSTIKLNKGVNRILLQIGASEIDNCNFQVRITNNLGDPVKDLTFSTVYSPYKKETHYKSNQLNSAAEEYFQNKITENPQKLFYYLLLSDVYLMNDKTFEARKLLTEAQKLSPKSSYLLAKFMEVYSRTKNRTSLSLVIEKFKDIDPDNPEALDYIFNEELDKGNIDEAKKILERLRVNTIVTPDIIDKDISIAYQEKRIDDMIKIVEKGYDLYPNYLNFINMMYAVNIKQNRKKAGEVLEDYLDKNNNYGIREKLADHYSEQGDVKSFISNYQQIIDYEPNSIEKYYQIALKYFNIQKYKESIEYIKKCIEIAPYVGTYHEELANAYQELNDKDNARQSYLRCLELNPYDFQARDKLRLLDNKKSLFESFATLDYYKIFKEAPAAEKYPGEFALILLNSVNKIVYSGGASEEKHHYLVKIFTSRGRDIFKEFSVPVMRNQSYIIEKAEVLKKDGSKLKAEVNENVVVFTNLQEGDAVLLVYKLQTFQFGSLSQYFSDNFSFTSFIPYLEKKYEIIVASDTKFEYKMMNSDIKPDIIKMSDEFSHFTWAKYNQSAVKEEAYMPSILDFGEVLFLSSLPSWDYVSKWYLDISKTKAKSDLETKEVADKLFPVKNNLSKVFIAKTIYNYIVNNVRYSSIPFRQSGIVPQKASTTINTQMGDCKDVATLFVALCNEMNLKATWVLVSTRDNGQTAMPLPSIEFNHCIATVNLDDKQYFVDLTNDDQPFGNIYGLNNHAIALVINDNPVNIIFNLTSIENQNTSYRQTFVSFINDRMNVKTSSLKKGGLAASTRANYKNKSKDEQMKDMSEAIASGYANIKLANLEFKSGLNDNSDTLEYSYTYYVDRVFIKISNLFAFKMPLTDAYSPIEFLANDERKYPIDLYQFSTSDIRDEILNIQIPDDKVLAEIPETIKINSKFGNYILEFSLEGNTLIVHRSYVQKELNVSSSEYKDLQKFFNDIVKSDETQIAFKAK